LSLKGPWTDLSWWNVIVLHYTNISDGLSASSSCRTLVLYLSLNFSKDQQSIISRPNQKSKGIRSLKQNKLGRDYA